MYSLEIYSILALFTVPLTYVAFPYLYYIFDIIMYLTKPTRIFLSFFFILFFNVFVIIFLVVLVVVLYSIYVYNTFIVVFVVIFFF
jgi:hypothetical protein